MNNQRETGNSVRVEEGKGWCVAHSNQSGSLTFSRMLESWLLGYDWLLLVALQLYLSYSFMEPPVSLRIYMCIYISQFNICRFCSSLFLPVLIPHCWFNMLPGDMFLSKVLCTWKFFLISVNSSSLLMMCIVFLEGMLFIKCLPAEQVTKHSRVLVQYLPAVSSTPM